ncbi:hypothetical protein TNCV_220241 [Trichonephila clavipes]|nr:hypothetical protein TNCV_220241 [Trichonephila clavipes]
MMNRIPICDALAKRKEIDPFLKRMVTGYEKWVTYDNIGLLNLAISDSTHKDEMTTKIKCQTLNLVQLLSFLPKTNTSISTRAVSASSSSTHAHLLSSISSIAATVSEPQLLIPMSDAVLSTSSNMFTPIELSSSIISTSSSNSSIHPLLPLRHTEFEKNTRDRK